MRPRRRSRVAPRSLALLGALVLGGCPNDDGSVDGGVADVGAPDGGCQELEPKFSALYPAIFGKRQQCSTSSCHGRSGASLSRMRLDESAAIAHTALLGDTQSPQGKLEYARRITPGSPADSYVWRVLTDPAIPEERQMPPGQRLNDCELAAIEAWITAGAMND